MFSKVLIIGGGLAGMRAALDLAHNGIGVVLVEKQPILGGSLAARLNDDSETFNLTRGLEIPKTSQVAAEPNIEVLTMAELTELSGNLGRFKATIRQRGRIVTDACTQCNRCRQACPVVVPNQFVSNLVYRKAIYQPLKQAVPGTYVIDLDHCLNDPPNYMPCQRCVEACEDNAIHFEMPLEQTLKREIGAVLVATGFSFPGNDGIQQFGYGEFADVLTSIEMERLLSPYGPTGGFIEKPSSEEPVESALFVMTDDSQFSWACAAAHSACLAEQEVPVMNILHSTPQFDERFRNFWQRTASAAARLIYGRISSVGSKDDGALRVRYEDLRTQQLVTMETDIVTFYPAVTPPAGLTQLAELLGLPLTDNGFVAINTEEAGLVGTARPGVYVCGCASGAKSIPDAIAESKAATIYAMRHLDRRTVPANPNFAAAAPEKAAGKSGVLIDGRWLTPEEVQNRIQSALLNMLG